MRFYLPHQSVNNTTTSTEFTPYSNRWDNSFSNTRYDLLKKLKITTDEEAKSYYNIVTTPKMGTNLFSRIPAMLVSKRISLKHKKNSLPKSNITLTCSPQYSFGQGRNICPKLTRIEEKISPGPGQYTISPVIYTRLPRWSWTKKIAIRNSKVKSEFTNLPTANSSFLKNLSSNQYNNFYSDQPFDRVCNTEANIRPEQNLCVVETHFTGRGVYPLSHFKSNMSKSFGRRTLNNQKNTSPGPGRYNIPSQFGDK